MKQELPVIPKYVGEFIEEVKASGDRLDDAFSILRGIYHQSEVADWVAKEKHNSETFARAWLDGYEVEKEKLYIVRLPTNLEDDLIILDAYGGIWTDSWPSRYKMTEKRIKEIDERYWSFAVEVAE